jgi:hypothetical protein
MQVIRVSTVTASIMSHLSRQGYNGFLSFLAVPLKKGTPAWCKLRAQHKPAKPAPMITTSIQMILFGN